MLQKQWHILVIPVSALQFEYDGASHHVMLTASSDFTLADFCLRVPQGTYSWHTIRYQVLHQRPLWHHKWPMCIWVQTICKSRARKLSRDLFFSISGASRDRCVRNQCYIKNETFKVTITPSLASPYFKKCMKILNYPTSSTACNLKTNHWCWSVASINILSISWARDMRAELQRQRYFWPWDRVAGKWSEANTGGGVWRGSSGDDPALQWPTRQTCRSSFRSQPRWYLHTHTHTGLSPLQDLFENREWDAKSISKPPWGGRLNHWFSLRKTNLEMKCEKL